MNERTPDDETQRNLKFIENLYFGRVKQILKFLQRENKEEVVRATADYIVIILYHCQSVVGLLATLILPMIF